LRDAVTEGSTFNYFPSIFFTFLLYTYFLPYSFHKPLCWS